MSRSTRRQFLQMFGAASAAGLGVRPTFAQANGRIVIVGAGFGGATTARYLRQVAPGLEVTLIEPLSEIVTCPFSNDVIAGGTEIGAITHGLGPLTAAGVTLVQDRAAAIDPDARLVRLAGGADVPYDRLVLSPGIDFKPGAIEGYDDDVAQLMPHAWKAGPQTLLLRDQLRAMPDGGVVVMTIPANSFRCPPGPYERASLIAHYLKTEKPRSKIILLDGKDNFSKQPLFEEAWAALYPGLIEWIPFAQGGSLLRVDAASRTVETEFHTQSGDVVNVIPPQRAAAIAYDTGLTGEGDWCTVNQSTFESTIAPNIHILGDAAIAGAMPKSGFSAGSQGKFLAYALAALQAGDEPPAPALINTCYSLVAPDYGISVADVFRIGPEGTLAAVQGAGGVSPREASAEVHKREAAYARGWYASITSEIWG